MLGKSHVADWDYSGAWYHGSPHRLTSIRGGSTITQDRDLARAFSHKPTVVSISDDGFIQHNGTVPGFLYRIAEDVQPGDVYPRPRSSLPWGREWLTRRDLRVSLIGPAEILGDEVLTDREIQELRRKPHPRC